MTLNAPYELVYFRVPGRAFNIRCMFRIAGIQFNFKCPSWPEEKPNMPYGRLPVLHVTNSDGSKFTLCESTVIERFIAHKHGFLPKDPQESAILEQYIAQICDFIEDFVEYFDIQRLDKSKSDKPKQKMVKTLEYLLGKHEAILSNSTSGYYYGDSISLADLYMYSAHICISSVEDKEANVFAKMEIPNILKLINLIDKNDSVQAARNEY